MTMIARTSAVGLFVLLVSAAPLSSQQPVLKPTSTAADVQRVYGGPPDRVARQIIARRYVEQWEYSRNPPVRVEFHYVEGKEPQFIPPADR